MDNLNGGVGMIQKKLAVVGDPNHAAPTFELANTDNLRHAVFHVLYRYQVDGKEPGAEYWQSDTRGSRPILIEDVRQEWCRWLGREEPFLPWHDDYVMLSWVALRKIDVWKKRELCNFYGLAIPEKWQVKPEKRDKKDGEES